MFHRADLVSGLAREHRADILRAAAVRQAVRAARHDDAVAGVAKLARAAFAVAVRPLDSLPAHLRNGRRA